jgi:surface polysaccharide O-acyltransferase-like enzyme
MFLQGMMNSVFTVGVPLFMMLTGYLNIRKTPTVKYYKGMVRVLVAYLFFSLVTIAFRKYYLGEELSIVQWVLKIFNYSAIPYAWYIEMWIGLALLTPFLNYLYHAIPTMKQKLLLIATLFVMTSLPNTINDRVELLPDYFHVACYPLLYYFMGSFIREYQPTIKVWVGWTIIFLVSLFNPVVTLLLVGPNSADWGFGGMAMGGCSVFIAVTIFLMFYRKDIQVACIKRWVTHCSMVSLEMYLCCWMFDQLYYPWFKERFYESQAQFLPWFLVIVPAVFLSSYIVASAYNFIAVKMRR